MNDDELFTCDCAKNATCVHCSEPVCNFHDFCFGCGQHVCQPCCEVGEHGPMEDMTPGQHGRRY